MELTTNHQASIFKGRSTAMGSIPTKAYQFHDMYNASKQLISIRFYTALNDRSLTFYGRQICFYGDKDIRPAHVLMIRYSGTEYRFLDKDVDAKFRELFQYDAERKNTVLMEVISNI